ncbi:DoxX family protein [Euzebya sp.]|uniref:DoxX family protein n=1 Tax=Euzebya sp. TaxID=1971409 RepID=UPI003512CC36
MDLADVGLADPAVGLLVLRVLVGVPFSLHGFQKLFGWFGGGGIDGTAGWFRSLGFGDGRTAAVMAGGGEVVGGLGLALGLLTPFAAAAMIGTMTTAAFVNNADGGFWSVSKGWELNGYLIVVATAVAITGPGAASLDHVLGLDALWGVLPGLAALVLGVAGGWARWASRGDPPADGG